MNFNFETDIILENDFVLLMPLALTDIESLLPVATADPGLLQYSPRLVHTRELLTAYIEKAIALRNGQDRFSYSIYNKSAKCYAGSTAFLNISNEDERLEIGATWIDKKYQGTGLNRHCKYLLLQYAFDTLHANRVAFITDERNIQSRKAIEKIGGKYEGILREHTVLYDGFKRNSVSYSILKQEWEIMKHFFLS